MVIMVSTRLRSSRTKSNNNGEADNDETEAIQLDAPSSSAGAAAAGEASGGKTTEQTANSNNTNKRTRFSIPGEGWTNKSFPQQMYPFHNTKTNKIEFYSTHRRLIHTNQSWTRVGDADPNDPYGNAKSIPSATFKYTSRQEEAKTIQSLMSQLCEIFYKKGWQVGTGGGISMRMGDGSKLNPYRVFTTPSGIQKEDMIGGDVFELDMQQNIITKPKTPGLKLSSMTGLWYIIYNLRPKSMCVLHTHSMYAQLATMLDPTETASTLKVTHLEMIKGVGNHGYEDMLEIPIIENQISEDKLGPDLAKAMMNHPKCNAVLVRRHGVYVWGDSWEQAKTQLECFDYLFETAVRMKSLGLDCGIVPLHSKKNHINSYATNGMIGSNTARVGNGIFPLNPLNSQLQLEPWMASAMTGTTLHQNHPQMMPFMHGSINPTAMPGSINAMPNLFHTAPQHAPPQQPPNINNTNIGKLSPASTPTRAPTAPTGSTTTTTSTSATTSTTKQSSKVKNNGKVKQPTKKRKTAPSSSSSKAKRHEATLPVTIRPQLQSSPTRQIPSSHLSLHPVPVIPIHAKTVIMTLKGCIVPTKFLQDHIYPFILKYVDKYFDQLPMAKLSALVKHLNVDTLPTTATAAEKNSKSNVTTECMTMKAYVRSMIKHNIQRGEFQELLSQIIAWTGLLANKALFTSLVFSDIEPFLKYCHSNDVDVHIFAQESFHIQNMILTKHKCNGSEGSGGSSSDTTSTQCGLSTYISGFHDSTTIGPLDEVASFLKLRNALGLDSKNPSSSITTEGLPLRSSKGKWKDVVFLSESEEELEAAVGSGIGFPVLCRRSEMKKNQNFEKSSVYPIVHGLGLMKLTTSYQ